ncbi:hypothetical protein [Marinobacter alkaliphilus]|uniref:Uncharacterized protein n=1 Tax=Marinobacter alkaliphilus TaxID=254719 RepID=A0ABZ3EA52_9GAMM
MSKERDDEDRAILNDPEKMRKIMDNVAVHLLSNRLIKAGLSLDKVNQVLAQTPLEEIKEMNAEALAMKECPGCGSGISPNYLEEAYFDYPTFRCQYCNTKLCVSVDEECFGYILTETK